MALRLAKQWTWRILSEMSEASLVVAVVLKDAKQIDPGAGVQKMQWPQPVRLHSDAWRFAWQRMHDKQLITKARGAPNLDDSSRRHSPSSLKQVCMHAQARWQSAMTILTSDDRVTQFAPVRWYFACSGFEHEAPPLLHALPGREHPLDLHLRSCAPVLCPCLASVYVT